ncbi:5'-nucleotidase [Bacillus anthracis 52-G]|nr:5'-nucleotidase [Bacillus anthracis 52-G]KFL67232.1 putative 5'-nucleotidase [Bacillus anthracis]
MLKKIIPVALALSTVIFTSVFAVPSAQASTEPNRYIDVQMLGINDFHGQLDTVKKLTIKMQGESST